MTEDTLIPHLFRTEYRKIVVVLFRVFGMEHIEVAEDIASDTFLAAAERWPVHGIPEQPLAWLYAVAKNKTRDYLRRNKLFATKISARFQELQPLDEHFDVNLSVDNINDSQLAMMFAVCQPEITPEAQIGLALNLLCGFSPEEIARAFLTNRDTVYKRLQRAREKLRREKVAIQAPSLQQINERLPIVLRTIYLLFNEGYYSESDDLSMRKDLCIEAMRLNMLLTDYAHTNVAETNALLALMCFQASRFDSRIDDNGEIVLYEYQDATLWDQQLIRRGQHYLYNATAMGGWGRYHIEAGIACCHTQQADTREKWNSILQLYNQLLMLEYSPIAALNRTFAVAHVHGSEKAILEAEGLALDGHPMYHSLLGHLYRAVDRAKAIHHFEKAKMLSTSASSKTVLQRHLDNLRNESNTIVGTV
jgi:RNA polymerase sigma factor (sigma-70 family)